MSFVSSCVNHRHGCVLKTICENVSSVLVERNKICFVESCERVVIICNALRDLILFVEFSKRLKHS